MANHHAIPAEDERPDRPTATRLGQEDVGYRKGLRNRQVQMIAMGGAIGTGLFL